MRICFHTFISAGLTISLLFMPKILAVQSPEPIQKAERLFEEALYMDALPLFEQALETDSELYSFILLRLAECHLELHQTKKALILLDRLPEPLSAFEQAYKTYLSAFAERQLGHYTQALQILSTGQDSVETTLQNEIQLERGLNLFQLNQLDQAKKALEAIEWNEKKPTLYFLAQLYLTRIALSEKENDLSQSYLKQLDSYLPIEHPFRFEMAYLQGLSCIQKQNDLEAVSYFEKALPLSPSAQQRCDWYFPTLDWLATAYLRQIASASPIPSKEVFDKTEKVLRQLTAVHPQERHYLQLAQCLLKKHQLFKDAMAYKQAEELLQHTELFESVEGKSQALLLQALLSTSPAKQKQLYRELIQLHEKNLIDQHPELLKIQILAYYYLNTPETNQQAWNLIQEWIEHKQHLLEKIPEPEEIYHLAGLIFLQLDPEKKANLFPHAESLLQKGIQTARQNFGQKQLIKTLAQLYMINKQWQQADETLTKLAVVEKPAEEKSEILFWQAQCAEQLGQEEKKKQLLLEIYDKFPKTSYAPLAYFNYYSYREYMRGSRKAIKHLQSMPILFPDHPWLINAYYFMGLDYKKDHRSLDGKIQRHRNLTAAIDAFQQAESTFEVLRQKNVIPEDLIGYFTNIRYRANLERALANLAIAEESQGSKKQIYLSYAEEVFKQIIDDFHRPEALISEEKNFPLLEESEFGLIQVYLKKGDLATANQWIDHILNHYRHLQIKQGYYLGRIWYEKGKISQQNLQFEQALHDFFEAELAAKSFSTDQKLDLWIQQALCYKELDQFDEAMRLLSKVVNDEAISGLRLKAMYLRATVYEAQGRPELALKQLEATAKKGGDWGRKAEEKLRYEYGY